MKIVWTNPAISDLKSIRDYIARDSEYYAVRFVERIIEVVDVLQKFPEFGQMVPEFEEYGIRERLLHNYRILYEVRTDHVLIHAIVHAKRDMGSFELER